MSLQKVTQMACGFCRVTLAGDVSGFTDAAIHFRLGLPPAGRPAPNWPYVGQNGATVWPKGEDALHLPVYTARHVDPSAGHLAFDLFQHRGGRATDWAATAVKGASVLVTGPGGGGCDIEGPILGFADETAFPAIARVLEANPVLTGEIHLYAATEASVRYVFPAHPGVTLTLHRQAGAPRMGADACEALRRDGDAYLWFAGERGQADKVRKAWKQAGGCAKRSYVSAYWRHAERG